MPDYEPLLAILLSALYKSGGVVTIKREELFSDFNVNVDSAPPGVPLDEADMFTLTVDKNTGG